VADYPDFYNQMDGGTTSPGHAINPATGQPYASNMVPRADYARVLAEFWADGPDSETPPGHWFTILNYVSDHEDLEKKFMGEGSELDDLEWDVKSYFMLGGAMHDAAVSTWGIKGWHDYLRPISAIRAMASRGQSSDPGGESYHPAGVPLVPGYVEVIAEGDPLAGDDNEYVGDIKIKAWKGHNAINNVDVDEAGVDWILASTWEPYQRPSFVTPPFAGYISGHSTFSRAAAEVLTSLTGDEYFPGGMGTFTATQDEFLVFEDGPSVDVELQWATYQDAADESGLSRIWGGIHPPCDDIPGRKNGIIIGQDAFAKALTYFDGCQPIVPCETDDPIAACQDVTVNLDETGMASLNPLDVDNGSSDECTVQENLILSLDITDFSCDDVDLSPITVTLTVTDEAGNSSECTSQVTVNPGNNCFDCSELGLNIGDECDDENPNTMDDVVTSDCECVGESIEVSLTVSLEVECADSYTIKLYEPGTANLVSSVTGSVNPDNTLTATGLPSGTFDVFVKLSGHLQKGFVSVDMNSLSNSMNAGSFTRGDLNDDNSIDIQDFSIFSTNYGRSLGDPGYNPLADLNCDDTINIIDFSVFSSNLGEVGDEAPIAP